MKADQTTPSLALDGISHSFGSLAAVRDFSLSLRQGEVVSLLGPSGCGKTTILRLIAGLETLQQGRLLLDGKPIAGPGRSLPPEKRKIGLVFQDFALFPHLNVIQNVEFGLRGLPGSQRHSLAMDALLQVGMERSRNVYPHTLSGGQQQRVALARALAPKPRVMLLDEPFSGLDAQLRAQIRDDTLHVLKQSGTTSLLVTHDPEEAMFMSDRIALMREGRIVQLDKPANLYFYPNCSFAAQFFGEINRLRSFVEGGKAATPFGPVEVEGLAEGTVVEVLIRPEALRLQAPSPTAPLPTKARVMASRMLGRSSLVHLAPLSAGPQQPHLHARVPGRYLPAEGEVLEIHLDRSQTFVFPAAEAN